ncbi:MAG: hypothetical protein ACD_36C00162G0003 [uncultured bacterium]|nr:MAG: hypothetical protein ACD_36C00162G0003 [uncultured bacterium]
MVYFLSMAGYDSLEKRTQQIRDAVTELARGLEITDGLFVFNHTTKLYRRYDFGELTVKQLKDIRKALNEQEGQVVLSNVEYTEKGKKMTAFGLAITPEHSLQFAFKENGEPMETGMNRMNPSRKEVRK